ncbi:hypothetical protein BC835DRAFT_1373925 [Cytidiella melzeri]|nr:hypothetical protein BC835DRAFT_1373925 [Cytidiella melzeri]
MKAVEIFWAGWLQKLGPITKLSHQKVPFKSLMKVAAGQKINHVSIPSLLVISLFLVTKLLGRGGSVFWTSSQAKCITISYIFVLMKVLSTVSFKILSHRE